MDPSILPPGMTPAATETYLQIQLELLKLRQQPGYVPVQPPPPRISIIPSSLSPTQLELLRLRQQPGYVPVQPPPLRISPTQTSSLVHPPPQYGLLHPLQSHVHAPESKEPLLTGLEKILSTKEAVALLKNHKSYTSNVLDMHKAPSGTAWLFKSKSKQETGDWRHVGHHFRQTGGAPAMKTGDHSSVTRLVAHIVRPDGTLDKNFRRITWTMKDNPGETLVQFWGDQSLSVPLVHGNSRVNMEPRRPILPSLARQIEASPMRATELSTHLIEEANEEAMTSGRDPELVQLVKTPTSKRQIRQLQSSLRLANLPPDQFAEMFLLSQNYSDVRLFTVAPRLLLVFSSDEAVKYMRDILSNVSWKESDMSQEVSYDTQFNIGDFYVSTLTLKDPRLRNKATGNSPIVPGFLVAHHRKYQWDHDLSFRAIIELVPELRTKMFVATSDNEFTPLLSNHFKGAFVAKCENHLSKQIGRWCEIKGKATKAEVSFYKNEFRVLIRCTSKAEYLVHLEARKKLWKLPGFIAYFDKHIDKNIEKSSLWEARKIGWKCNTTVTEVSKVTKIKKGNTIFNSNQSESWNSKFLKLCGAKKLTFPELFQVFRMAQYAHLYEVARALMGMGEYSIKPQFVQDSDGEKGKKLLETVGQCRREDVKKEVKRLADARQRQQGPPRLQGRGFPTIKEAAFGADEDLEEEVRSPSALARSPAAPVRSPAAPVRSPAAPVRSPPVEADSLSGSSSEDSPSPPRCKASRTILFSQDDSPSPEMPERFSLQRGAKRKGNILRFDDLCEADLSSDSGDDKQYEPSNEQESGDEEDAQIPEVRKELKKLGNVVEPPPSLPPLPHGQASTGRTQGVPLHPTASPPPPPSSVVRRSIQIHDYSLNLFLDLESEEEAGDEEPVHEAGEEEPLQEAGDEEPVLEAGEDEPVHEVRDEAGDKEPVLEAGEDEPVHEVRDVEPVQESGEGEASDEESVQKEGSDGEKEHETERADGWWLKEHKDANDPHPTVNFVAKGVWELQGKKDPIYINPSKNSCSFCTGRTKNSWCSHLVSAGLREGTIYMGRVYRLPLAQSLKVQQPSTGRSGTKAPRKFDYNPPLAAVQEVHKVIPETEGHKEDEADLPDPESKSPTPPVIRVTPSTPKALSKNPANPCDCSGCSRPRGYRCNDCSTCQNRRLKKACLKKKCVRTKPKKRKSPPAIPKGMRKKSPPSKKVRKTVSPPTSAANSPKLVPRLTRASKRKPA